jgi:hypothetical protein
MRVTLLIFYFASGGLFFILFCSASRLIAPLAFFQTRKQQKHAQTNMAHPPPLPTVATLTGDDGVVLSYAVFEPARPSTPAHTVLLSSYLPSLRQPSHTPTS